jgi:hypothetical protein
MGFEAGSESESRGDGEMAAAGSESDDAGGRSKTLICRRMLTSAKGP